MARPLIAITGPLRGAFGPRLLVAAAVRLYGGRPLQLHPGDPLDPESWAGVVITGGHDIDPVLYAAEPEVEPRYDAARDQLELAVIEGALRRHLPLLGICRGAQLLNAFLGGSLFQQLRAQRRMTSNRWTVLPLKTLLVEPQSRLAELIGCTRCRINSLHNQAIDRPGTGLRVAARDLDGIVQAVEAPDHDFLLGLQWHPEFLLYSRRQRRLFQHLLACARRRQADSQID